MTLKAGQKCTTIRRILVPRQQPRAFGDAVTARLSSMKVGNPRNPDAKVGPVVNKAQQSSCLEGLSKLKEEREVCYSAVTRTSSRLTLTCKSLPLCNPHFSLARMDSTQNTFMTSRFSAR
jgi:acyl-CoA reductase-like NAD-dependent aldehyde dehydrogenase